MLFDPLKEQLNLPTAFVKLGDCQSRKFKIIGEEGEALIRFLVVENDVT